MKHWYQVAIAVLMSMILLVGSVSCATAEKTDEERLNELFEKMNYNLETDVWYVIYGIDDKNPEAPAYVLPELYPGIHGARIYRGMYLEVPTKIYMMVTSSGYVVWKVDYNRIKDVESGKSEKVYGVTANHTEAFYHTVGEQEIYYVKCEIASGQQKSLRLYVEIEMDEATAKEIGGDAEPGLYAITLCNLRVLSASKPNERLEVINEATGTRYVLVKAK